MLTSTYTAMSLSIKERDEREKQRREIANARMREKVAAAWKRGICRCGGKLDNTPHFPALRPDPLALSGASRRTNS